MFNKCIGTGIKLYPDHPNLSAILTYFFLLVKMDPSEVRG